MENTANKKHIEVAAALIWQGGRFMICRRPEGKKRGLLWEFVGGKLEPGESAEEALVRECHEELDITVEPQELFADVTYDYPDVEVRMRVFNTVIEEGKPTLLEHFGLVWILPEEIDGFEFCPADYPILEKIKKEKLK